MNTKINRIKEYYFYYDKENWHLCLSCSKDVGTRISVKLVGENELIDKYFELDNIYAKLPTVKLWSPSSPCLYNLNISLFNEDNEVEHITQKVGFRYFENIDGQYYLNDKIVEEILFTSLEEIDDDYLNLCDEEGKVIIGNVISDQITDIDLLIERVARIIVSYRHHPSICAWSIGNLDSKSEKIIRTLVNLIDPMRMIMK